MHRTMQVLEGLGHHQKQSSIYPHPYDHPYFGQYFLAGMLAILGYPQSLHLSSSNTNAAHGDLTHSIEMLYLIPRVLIGLLAVLDTFFVYKIAERRYSNNRTIALIASILFAVMPITWVLRKILLESLLLPLLLLSILLALYISKDQIRINYNSNKWRKIIIIRRNKNIPLVLLSGIFLGLAILTKIPVFTMIPLVGYLVYTSTNKNWKIVGLWLIPVILIPLSWPIDAIFNGDYDLWLKDVIWNIHRQNNNSTHSAVGGTLLSSLKYLFQIEPVLLILGFAGIFFAEIKRDFLILLWVAPFLVFLFIINFVSFFHLIPLIPAFCIAGARLIVYLSSRINHKKIYQIMPFAIISGISVFGIVNITMLITTNVTSTYFKIYATIAQYLTNEKVNDHHNNNNNVNDKNNIITMIGGHWTRGLYWIPKYVYNIDLDFKKVDKVNDIPLSVKGQKAILIVDNTIKRSLSDNTNNNDIQNRRRQQQQLNLYYNTIPIAAFNGKSTHYELDKYPYASMSENRDTKWVEIRGNANTSNILWDIY